MTQTETKALATIEDGPKNYAMLPDRHEWNVLQAMAKTASNTRFFSQLGGEAGILSIMLYARELNIPPMAAVMGGFHNIQGRVEMSSRLMTMRIRQAGHAMSLKHLDHEKCVVSGKRTDTGETMEASYTFQEAKEAGLVKDGSNWMKFRQDMLWARAISRLARRLYPDVIGTAYVDGEILEMIPERSDTRILPPEEAAAVAPDFDALEDAPAFDELLPDDVDHAQVEKYVRTCAEHFNKSAHVFKSEIVSNNQLDEFLSAFRKWERQNVTQSMDQGEKAQQSEERLSGDPKEEPDPWQEFRSEFINLRSGGYSTWVFKNKKRLEEAPEEIREEAKAKWGKLYQGNPWPLDSKPEAQEPDTPTEDEAPRIPAAWDMPVIIEHYVAELGSDKVFEIIKTENPEQIPKENRLAVIEALKKAAEDAE